MDDLDKEPERRGHCFCRYADDSNIYVKSERSGQRVFESISAFLKKRLKINLIKCFHRGRGRNLKRFIKEDLNPKLRGWFNYFSMAEVKNVFEELDSWIRRHLRNILWRQWKRPRFRVKKLMNGGLSRDRARQSAYNGQARGTIAEPRI